jgi:hypothetical protein
LLTGTVSAACSAVNRSVLGENLPRSGKSSLALRQLSCEQLTGSCRNGRPPGSGSPALIDHRFGHLRFLETDQYRRTGPLIRPFRHPAAGGAERLFFGMGPLRPPPPPTLFF